MLKGIIKSIVFLLVASIIFGTVVCYAEKSDKKVQEDVVLNESIRTDASDYENYVKDGSFKNSEKEISVSIENFESADSNPFLSENAIDWDGNGSIIFNADITDSALYSIKIVWKPKKSGIDPNLGIMIDGEFPFEGANQLELKRQWKNISESPRVDASGNEYAQEQIETGEYITSVLQNYSGIINEPYSFKFTKGLHKITLVGPEQPLLIKEITLTIPEVAENYSAVSKKYNLKPNDSDIITIQAENADIKNSKSLIPKSNNSDASMTPNDPYRSKINFIGGTSWQAPGSMLTWKFNVEADGYYYLGFRYKQSELINGVSWRKLRIDGKVPFEEAKNIGFNYGTGWEYFTLENEETPYYIWLTKGEHTLSLEVTVGPQSEYVKRLSEVVNRLGDEYIKIVMITGESPDANRDYELFNQIEDFNKTLTECKDSLDSIVTDMKKISGSKSTQSIAAIENMSRVLKQMIKSPYVAQQYVKDYYNNYTAVSSWLYDMKNMPLALDEIQVVPYTKSIDNKNVNFFKSFYYGTLRLVASFIQDYNFTEKGENNKKITIWINWGQDQAMVLNSLIKDSFTPEHNIDVRIDVVSASLINGILSGNFPDLSLHLARTEPVNLGIRGALYDLTNFSDCDDVLNRFQTTSEEPYRYGDALYALPDTQSYFLMYYRKDIMEKLGLDVPQNWNEFKHAAMVIQRNNMNVYVPYTQITTATTVNTGIGSLNLFPTLMAQNGLSLYNKEKTATALNSKAAIDVFDFWTDLYTKYGYLKEAEFYNRFRVGVVPLGIAPLATYMNLYSAAPEIAGRWSVGLVPASDSGSRAIAGAGTGCGIISKSANKEEAWEFLKWWTSAETQTRYNNNVESILGTIGRTTTANVEAFQNLAWDAEHLTVMEEQRLQVKEVSEVPGSYYLSRAIDQAYWSVVNGESNSKDAVMKWSKIADEEIARKIKEYQ